MKIAAVRHFYIKFYANPHRLIRLAQVLPKNQYTFNAAEHFLKFFLKGAKTPPCRKS